jgi:hypothetical protein
MKKKKKDTLNHWDFNFLNRNSSPLPENDSPGSSSENTLIEFLLGMQYGEETLEEMQDDQEMIPADYPAELERESEKNENIILPEE